MTLEQAAAGETVRITSLPADGALAARLRALGIREGAQAEILHVARGAKTVYVRTASGAAALGCSAAQRIGIAR